MTGLGGLTALGVRRPVLIAVANLLIMLAGIAAILGVDVRELPNVDRPVVSVRTIMPICALAVWPAPTTDFLTRLAAYSATGSPARAGASSTTPRARPSFSVLWGLRLTKVSSMAAASGRWAAMAAAMPS